jgi:hypothetical protein
MPALKDEEFGFQVDQKDDNEEEESSEEGDEEESSEEEDDDDEETEEEETTDGEEETEESGDAETSGDDDDDDDEDDDDEEDEDEETADDDDEVSSQRCFVPSGLLCLNLSHNCFSCFSVHKKDESEEDDDDKDEETFEDEAGLISGEAADRSTEDADKKKRQIGVAVICLLLVAIILGLGLGLGLRDKDDDETPAPTAAPTPNVTAPPTAATPTIAPTGENQTMAPTNGEALDEVIVMASADTTIYVDGQFQGDNFGERDTMLVQGGQSGDPDLPTAYALVQFDLNRTELAMLEEPVEIEFCLEHVVSAVDIERVVTYAACLLPFSSPVSEYTGSNITFSVPADCINGITVTFDISPADEMFCIPATELVLGGASSGTDSDITVRRLRGWYQNSNRKLLSVDDVLVLAMFNLMQSDQPGDEFYTSNDPDGRVPMVEFTSLGNATDFPTETMEPNATEVPEPQYEPCSICGNNFTATILDAEVPGSGGLNCEAVQEACSIGFCDPSQCDALPLAVNEICGCTTSNPGEVGI